MGIHEVIILIMILVAGIGYLIERFAPEPADSDSSERESGAPE